MSIQRREEFNYVAMNVINYRTEIVLLLAAMLYLKLMPEWLKPEETLLLSTVATTTKIAICS